MSQVPFSIVCLECDAGMNVHSYEEALALGWTDIEEDRDLPQANYIGLCPDCEGDTWAA